MLGDRRDVHLARQVVHDTAAAAATGMAGSPTLLIDGIDPFAGDPAPAPSLSCRLYRDQDGAVHGCPSLAQLRTVLDH